MTFLKKYNAGKFILSKEGVCLKFWNSLVEYVSGVTLARSSINRLKPEFINKTEGDILEIGGYESFLKNKYQKGKFLNLDEKPGLEIDIVANAENMTSITNASFSAVICISVLEHTQHPEKILNEIFRILKPGGKVFLSTPWLFETHMAPQDFHRFSEYYYQLPHLKNFKLNTLILQMVILVY
jgi:SAM-dependent methyltransferase